MTMMTMRKESTKSTESTMTKQSQRPKRKTGSLKMLLLTSSLVMTLAGTQLLNIREALQPSSVIAERNAAVVQPASLGTQVVALSPGGEGQVIVLEQIPQVVQPQFRPVARSRSSS